MHACAGRVGDDHVRPAVLREKIVRAYIRYIAGKKAAMPQAVERGIFLRIFHRIFHGFYADNLFRAAAAEDADAAGAAVQVVEHLGAGEPGKAAGDAVKLLCLCRIGLEKRFRGNLEQELIQLLADEARPRIGMHREAVKGIVGFTIDGI